MKGTPQVFCAGLILLQGLTQASDVNPVDVAVDTFRGEHPEFSQPSQCSDGIFLRRVSLDLSGYPPTPDELAAFEADTALDKDDRLIRRLLASDRYSWKWGRWLTLQTGADEQELSYAASEMQCTTQDLFLSWLQWMRQRVRNDEPYHQIVENCILATSREGRSGKELYRELQAIADADQLQTTAYAERKTNDLFWRRYSAIYDPEFRSEDVALRFLGVDLRCARCHDHPSEPLTMQDHQQFTAIFQPVKYSEMPFTKTQKQSIMMTLAILAVLLCFAFLWGVSKSRKRGVIFQRRIVNSLPTVVAFVIVLGVSYLHILPGSPIQHRTSPGRSEEHTSELQSR